MPVDKAVSTTSKASTRKRRPKGSKVYYERSPLRTVGRRGLRTMSGRINEEYLSALRDWNKESKIYLEMRDDVTIGTLLDAVKLPLVSAEFEVRPAGSKRADKQAAAWLEEAMHSMNKQTWADFYTDCLEALDFGFYVGEIILEKRSDGRLWIRNIDPRGQETLDAWKFDKDDGVSTFVQRDPETYSTIGIPISKCVHVTFRGRKGNPQGKSVLRSLYRPWRFAKDLENLEGIGIERDIGGMPVAKLPQGYISRDDNENLKRALKSLRNDEAAYLILDDGVEVAPYGSGSKMYDIAGVIERKKKEILGRFFAQFLMLGMDKVGTQALVAGSQDFFAYGLLSVQRYMLEPINQQLVPYLFSFNTFEGMTGYPQITQAAPGKVDIARLLDAYDKGVSSGVLKLSQDDEEHVRRLSNLPDATEQSDVEVARENEAGTIDAQALLEQVRLLVSEEKGAAV